MIRLRAANPRPNRWGNVEPSPVAQTLPGPRDVHLWLAGCILTVYDTAVTAVWVGGGWVDEANPLLAEAMSIYGVDVALMIRTAVGLAALTWLASAASQSRTAAAGLRAAVAALGAVAVWHVAGTVTLLTRTL